MRKKLDNSDIKKIEKKINYSFSNKDLLKQAFIRKSFSEENGGVNNEVMELIGDRVLDLSVLRLLMNKFSNYQQLTRCKGELCPQIDEGQLTEIKKNFVEKKMLANRMDFLCLKDYLIMGNGDVAIDASNITSVKEDLFEAIIGAVALDCDYNFYIIDEVVTTMLNPEHYLNNGFDEDSKNYISLVQEWYQKRFKGNLKYKISKTDDMYNAFVSFKIDGFEEDFNFQGIGKSKGVAKMNAARNVYECLEREDILSSLEEEIGEFDLENSVNKLQELYQKDLFSKAEYDFESKENLENGETNWNCKCYLKSEGVETYGHGTSKIIAKKEASLEMLKQLIELFA